MSYSGSAFKSEDGASELMSIGDILQRTRGLTAEQVERALDFQRQNGVRFGEAVVALGLARSEDVVWALAQQFHYPYAPEGEGKLCEELVVANDPFLEDVEAFRDLRSQLLLGVLGDPSQRRALTITSSDEADGKTFVAANLAAAFSQLPGRTLIVDANLRKPRLHHVFGVDSSSGLSGVLAGRSEQQVVRPVEYLSNLYVLPAGVLPPNPTELLQRASLSLLLRELLAKFDHVLVDTPSHSTGSDARIISVHCGAALMVGRKNRSRVKNMQAFIKLLNKSNVKLAGVLMNEY